MNEQITVEPGDSAPVGGTYEVVDSLGRQMGVEATVQTGETLPSTMRGYKWRLKGTTRKTPNRGSQS